MLRAEAAPAAVEATWRGARSLADGHLHAAVTMVEKILALRAAPHRLQTLRHDVQGGQARPGGQLAATRLEEATPRVHGRSGRRAGVAGERPHAAGLGGARVPRLTGPQSRVKGVLRGARWGAAPEDVRWRIRRSYARGAQSQERVARRALAEMGVLKRKERQEFVKAEKPFTVWLREKVAEKAKAEEKPPRRPPRSPPRLNCRRPPALRPLRPLRETRPLCDPCARPLREPLDPGAPMPMLPEE